MGGTGPGGGASFFGGFAKGFGQSILESRQRKHAEELEQEAKQYKVLQDALHVASSRGDTPAIAHILRSMEEFSTVGVGTKGGKGKKGKAARQGLLSKFADALEGGKQTPESQQAMQQNQQMIQQGTPEQGERPRRALTQPLMQSNRQLAEEETALEIQKQKTLLPIKTEEQKQLIRLRAEETRETEAQKAAARMDAIRLQTEGRQNMDQAKLEAGYIAQGIAPELAHSMSGKDITDLQEARTAEIRDRVANRQKVYSLHYQNYIESVRHHKQLEARALEASKRGDKGLALRIQKAASGTNEINKSMQADISRQREIQSEINRLEGIVSNPLSAKDPNIQKYRNNLDDLTKQWKALNDKIDQKQQQLDEIGASIEEKRLHGGTATPSAPSTGEGKTLRDSNRKYKVIKNKEDGKKYKFYGYKPDGSPDMEEIPEQ